MSRILLLCSLFFGLFLILTSPTYGQEMICSTEFATGILYDVSSQRWLAGSFRTDTKYVIVKSKRNGARLQVRRLGSDVPIAFCASNFSEDGTITCGGLGNEFFFNKKTLRFLHTYTAGYWNENVLKQIVPERKEGDDTPAITGGVCASI